VGLSGVEVRLVNSGCHYRIVLAMLVKQFFDLFVAFATVAADTKTLKQLAAGADAIVDGCGYLLIRNCFTNTYIHCLYLRTDGFIQIITILIKKARLSIDKNFSAILW
jgi:hypothetical protein